VVFMLFDGDGFILQRQQFFTRIHSGAVLEASSRGANGYLAWTRWQCARVAKSWLDLFQSAANAEDGKA
jgi:hypothetical protein